ncbi:ankyrin repeat domain-containing protein [Devosia sp. ZB163]|uniref:ankyrin repeat domain-containing protein n=1 Tax=Devosia sp. ZB163 TaxID=3025938 RepID=UPI00235F0681|nr:ankyrin repeat domain-containing protein [Devosia sp. ZB163]MDC9824318.1 ankyrin repeat domain-containing protein [Devosia sp. ZB163]
MKDAGAVHQAVLFDSLEDLLAAIDRGEPVDAEDRQGRTALFYSVQRGNVLVVSALIAAGVQVNVKDRNGETPLHFAAREQHPEIVDLLLVAGAEIDPVDRHGNTPLFRAVFDSRGRGAVIKQLLDAGADWSLSNLHGVSPLELAKSIANHDVVQFFVGRTAP